MSTTTEQLLLENAALRQQNEELRLLAAFPRLNPNPVMEFDRKGQARYANLGAHNLLSRLGLTDFRLMLPSDFPEMVKKAENGIERIFRREIKKGEIILGETISFPLENDSVHIYAADITQQVLNEEALAESRQELRRTQDLLESVTKGTETIIATVDKNYCYTYFNRAYFEEMKRLSGKEIHIGMNMLEAFEHLPEQQKIVMEEWGQVLNGQSSQKILDFGDPGIYRRTYRILHTPIRDAQGQLIGAGEVAIDITKTRQVEEALVESELRLKRAQEIAHVGSWELDLIRDELSWSDEVYRIFGLQPQEFDATYEAFLAAVHPDDRTAVDEAYTGSIRAGHDSYEIEHRIVTPGGEVRFVHEKCEHQRNSAGEITRSVGMVQDITERKRMEDELRINLTKYAVLFNSLPVGVTVSDQNGKIIESNREASRLLSLPTDEFERRQIDGPQWNIIRPDGTTMPPEEYASVRALHEHRRVENVEMGIVKDDQPVTWISVTAAPLTLEGYGVVIAYNDITQRVEAEEALKQAHDELEIAVQQRTQELQILNQELLAEIEERKLIEAQLKLQTRALETAASGIIITDDQGGVQWANPAFTQMSRFTMSEVVGKTPRILKSGIQEASFYKNLWDTILAGDIWSGELTNRRKDGNLYQVEQIIIPVIDDAGKITNFIAISKDITAQKQAEEALRKSEEQFRTLVIATAQIVWGTNAAGEVVEDIPTWREFTGQSKDEIMGQGWINALHPDDRQRTSKAWTHALETKTIYETEYRIKNKTGEYSPFSVRGVPIIDRNGNITAWIGTCTDITEKKQYETQLIQAEKHAVIGRMVGAVTHEINNPLQTIKNCLYLIKQDTPATSSTQEPLEMATSETQRLANLVAQLRELYRPRTNLETHDCELLEIIAEVHKMVKPQLSKSNVTWAPSPDLTCCTINCVKDQIIEVLLNICMNSIDAMQPNGGVLSVKMLLPPERDKVGVVISDTGQGIDAHVLDHIFEPFYTTKTSGLGLGLSITYEIIQKHGGQIIVDSQPGQGTDFTIWLPLAEQGQGLGE